MRIGYACLVLGVPDTELRAVQARFALPDKLENVIRHNLHVLENMLRYNAKNNIHLFRISSDIIPLATHDANTLDWRKLFATQFKLLSNMIKEHGIRVSMHPGQYTVLNSPDTNVVNRAMADLEYHAAFLDALETDATCKIILHIGGVYGDKASAMQRFVKNYHHLSDSVKKRLVIENDERSYSISDALALSEQIKTPVVFDNLHHHINKPQNNLSDAEWISICAQTWHAKDGKQKIHYSQQNVLRQPGAHSQTINHSAFCAYYLGLPVDIDIMLEVKDKNLSAVKCINMTMPHYKVQAIEKEWAKYKYFVLSRSQKLYDDIRTLLKDKETNVTNAFYDYIAQAYATEPRISQEENAFLHVWRYFKKIATDKEKATFFKYLDKIKSGDKKPESLIVWLHNLAKQYDIRYLLNSLYFVL